MVCIVTAWGRHQRIRFIYLYENLPRLFYLSVWRLKIFMTTKGVILNLHPLPWKKSCFSIRFIPRLVMISERLLVLSVTTASPFSKRPSLQNGDGVRPIDS